MQMELMHRDYANGEQAQCSIQGFAVNGLMIYLREEVLSPDTYLTVRTPYTTLVERIDLEKLHDISDYHGGNSNDGLSAAFVYVDLGLVSLGDSEEMTILLDMEGTPTPGYKIGVAALIDDLPEHDELIYHYQHHTDTSFNSDAAAALYVFQNNIHESADLVNIKCGDDVRSTTLRSTNWYANLMGKIELDNVRIGVVFDNSYGQPLTYNTAATGVTAIVKRVVQVDEQRRDKATARLAGAVVKKFNALDDQTRRAIP